MDYIYQVLHSTNVFSERKFHAIYAGSNYSLQKSIELSQQFFEYYDADQMDAELLKVIIDGMVDYVENLPASVGYRADLWKRFIQWIERIASEFHLEKEAAEILKGYDTICQLNPVIELVKGLHNRNGVTKAELSDQLHVSEKSIQTMLRQLDSDLGEGKATKECNAFYVAGQQVKAKVSYLEENDGRGHIKRRFRTTNSVHPIFLQENIMQVGTLLRALAYDYLDNEHAVSRGIAIDVWCQLSEYAKERIQTVFGAHDENLRDFLEEMDMEITDSIPLSYLTEREMIQQQDLNLVELLMSVSKRNAKVDVTYLDDGLETDLKGVYVEFGNKPGEYDIVQSDSVITTVFEQDIIKIKLYK